MDFEGRVTEDMVDNLIYPSSDMEGHPTCELVSVEEIKSNPEYYLRYATAYPEIYTEELMEELQKKHKTDYLLNFVNRLSEKDKLFIKELL